jgi:hypothetical protein
MNDEREIIHHARILSAYIERIPLKGLREIIRAHERGWNSQLNLGSSAQIESMRERQRITLECIELMSENDLLSVTRTIEGRE